MRGYRLPRPVARAVPFSRAARPGLRLPRPRLRSRTSSGPDATGPGDADGLDLESARCERHVDCGCGPGDWRGRSSDKALSPEKTKVKRAFKDVDDLRTNRDLNRNSAGERETPHERSPAFLFALGVFHNFQINKK